MKKLLFLFMALVVLQSCQKEECEEDILCASPPKFFKFNMVEKATGENVFANGTYSPEQIEVVDTAEESKMELTFLEENERNLLLTFGVREQTGTALYSIQLAGEEVFTLYLDAERLSENCCTVARYNEIRIEGAAYEFNEENEVYTILLE